MKKLMKMVLSAWCLVLGAEAARAAELPEGYTAVDYIVAPCYSYLDTGYTPCSDTRVEMDVTVKGKCEYWFGAWDHDWNDDAYALGNDNTGVYAGYGDDNSGTKGDVVGNGRHTVELSNRWVKVDGEITRTMNEQSFRLENSLYLFAQNRKGKAAPCVGQVDITCHGCKIYEGSDLVRDFVPCVRMSDGAVGFYDLAATGADKVFYANDGTGTFAIPPDAFCTVTIGDYPHMTAAWTGGDGSVTNAISGMSFEVEKGTSGVKVIFTAKQNYVIDGESVVELGAVTEDVVFGDGNDYAVPKSTFALTYLDWDYEEKKLTNATLAVQYEMVTSFTGSFEDGKWYVVSDDVEIRKGFNINVIGSAHLILCDNASLTVNNTTSHKGAIDVSANGSVTNSLTIYGQQDGSGTLVVNGAVDAAGIGVGSQGPDGTISGGTVTINGGTVIVTGGADGGAGIGGGGHGNGGVVTINGGTVTARGGEMAAGIGGGNHGAGGMVTVNGGTVTARGGEMAAGIGGGSEGAGGEVAITGGRVTAKGDDWPGIEDIGHGMSGTDSGTVTISGGLFGRTVRGDWLAEGYAVFDNPDLATSFAYPYVVLLAQAVTLGKLENMSAWWTCEDGSVTNAVDGEKFYVASGTKNVKVIFVPDERYTVDTLDISLPSPLEEDYVLEEKDRPTAIRLFTVTVPEVEGAAVTAWTNDVPVDGFAGGELIVLSNTTVTVVYAATEGWALQGETGFAATVESDLNLPAEGDAPMAIRLFTVTVPEVENATAKVTTNGAEVAGFTGGGLVVLSNTTVMVDYVKKDGWMLVGETHFTAMVESDMDLPAEGDAPTAVELIPGSERRPWSVGDSVTAWTNGVGTLFIEGTGATDDFASGETVPWADAAGKITAVMVSEDVILGKNALAGFADTMTVNGLSISFQKMVAASTDSAGPSGAISGAEFEQLQIIDGKAYLDVSVYTSDTVTNQNWSVATNGVIVVPAPGKQGFFYLISKPAVPSNRPIVPPPLPIEQ